jgi:hypothetical protein
MTWFMRLDELLELPFDDERSLSRTRFMGPCGCEPGKRKPPERGSTSPSLLNEPRV